MSKEPRVCHSCLSREARRLLDFGFQSKSGDYWDPSREQPPAEFPFTLGQCASCGVIQLEHPLSPNDLIPKHLWLENKEPTSHHDDLAETLGNQLPTSAKVLAVSHFDKIIADILRSRGYQVSYLLEPSFEQCSDNSDKKEMTQAALHESLVNAKGYIPPPKVGGFDLVISTRMLEHAQRPRQFIETLGSLLGPGGRLMLEVPDSTKPLLQGDVAMLWEEHTNYFTPESLRRSLRSCGFDLVRHILYCFPQEDALAGVFERRENGSVKSVHWNPSNELVLGTTYKEKIFVARQEAQRILRGIRSEGGEIWLFGGGHRTIAFINLLEIADLVSGVIDDDPNKQGLCLPGSKVRVESSTVLSQIRSGICMLSVNLLVESKIRELVKEKSGGRVDVYSISPDSPFALSKLWEH